MASVTAPRKSSKSKVKAEPVATLCMSLDHQVYGLTLIRGIRDPDVLKCWRLEKKSDLDCVYDVAVHRHGGISCECPDWHTRHHDFNTAGCKHIRGLVALGLIEPARPVPVIAPAAAPAPAPCCDEAETSPCSSCVAEVARHPGPAAPAVEPGRDEPLPAVEPEAPGVLPPADPDGGDDGDGDDEPWGDDDRVDLGPMAEPIPATWGKPAGPQSAGIWGRLPKGPDPLDRAWKAGYDAGRAGADEQVRDLEYRIAQLESERDDLRAELLADAGR